MANVGKSANMFENIIPRSNSIQQHGAAAKL